MFLFSPILRWPTANGIEKCNWLLPFSEHHSTQWCPLWMNKTPMPCKRKVDHYPVVLGALRLFLIYPLRDLSIDLGGRKALLSQCSHLFYFMENLLLSRFCYLFTFPLLECIFLLFFCSLFQNLCCVIW